MERQEAINYLNNLQKGMFCTVNLPLYGNEVMPITAMYMGKDKDGRYNLWIQEDLYCQRNLLKIKQFQ